MFQSTIIEVGIVLAGKELHPLCRGESETYCVLDQVSNMRHQLFMDHNQK